MDTSDSEDDWKKISTTVKSADTWKLHSLSVDGASESIKNDDARGHYYDCLYHFQGTIRTFTMTADMISGSYKNLQGFQQLTLLTIKEGVVHNLGDCCNLFNYLPQLAEATVYFNNSTNTATEAAATGSITYPKIRSMNLNRINTFSPLNQQDDLLHIKRFTNLSHLNITLPKTDGAAKIQDLVDNKMLDYIQREIPSYDITMYTDKEVDECQYLDLCCNRIQKIRGDMGKNNPTFRLCIDFDDEPLNYNQIIFKNNNEKETSAAANFDGEIQYAIRPGGGTGSTELSKVQNLLQRLNDIITEIFLTPHGPRRAEDTDIGYYITGVRNYSRCQKIVLTLGSSRSSQQL